MKVYELKPESQKSFYGKATVFQIGNRALLKSYDTEVCEINTATGDFVRYWDGFSATTHKHINAFRAAFGLDRMTGKEWRGLPVARFEWVKFYAPVMASMN